MSIQCCSKGKKRTSVVLALVLAMLFVSMGDLAVVKAATRTVTVSSTSELKSALSNAQAGDTIVVKPGTYTGTFSSSKNGTSSNPITITSEEGSSKAVLKGSSQSSGIVLNIKGDYWRVRKLKVTNGQKGIVLDNANNCHVYDCEVYDVGMEGIHIRDNSCNNNIDKCIVKNTGKVNQGYGEGIYVGTANSAWDTYGKDCNNNKIKRCTLGPGITAEHIDIKEGTVGTIVEDCTMNGTGITGEHYADSFMDVKGNNAIIRNNTCNRNNNSNIKDAFQGSVQLSGWGKNNDFYGNVVNLNNSTGYVIKLSSGATAKASNNTRTPSGNMYSGSVTQY